MNCKHKQQYSATVRATNLHLSAVSSKYLVYFFHLFDLENNLLLLDVYSVPYCASLINGNVIHFLPHFSFHSVCRTYVYCFQWKLFFVSFNFLYVTVAMLDFHPYDIMDEFSSSIEHVRTIKIQTHHASQPFFFSPHHSILASLAATLNNCYLNWYVCGRDGAIDYCLHIHLFSTSSISLSCSHML